jgi:adenine-specific DNA-methyltransferase
MACKRADCRERKSAFNSKRGMREAMEEVIEACGGGKRSPALVVSFNDEGYLSRAELSRMLSARGRVRVIERDYKRYVGAQIGIYNPSGERVGKVSHLRNTEMLFVVTQRRTSPASARRRMVSCATA